MIEIPACAKLGKPVPTCPETVHSFTLTKCETMLHTRGTTFFKVSQIVSQQRPGHRFKAALVSLPRKLRCCLPEGRTARQSHPRPSNPRGRRMKKAY